MSFVNGSKKTLIRVLVLVIIIAGAFGAGAYVGFDIGFERSISTQGTSLLRNDNSLQPIGIDFTPVWKTWHILNEKYVPASTTLPVSDEDKVWGLIEGLAESLGDPYTVFLPPEDSAIFQEDINGNFEGVGMEIGIQDGILTVVSPLKGTPAYRAGILAGDKIITIDETSTDSLSIEKAVKLIRGPRGTTVTLTVAREGENEFIIIPIVRAVIEIPTIDTHVEYGDGKISDENKDEPNDDVFVIQLYNFSAVSPGAFRDALRRFIESGKTKLILDLRGNPGGYLEVAVDMASWFLPLGKIVVTEEYGEKKEPNIHRSRGYDIFNENLEMVVLVNNGSASASEILAGALKEYDIATIIGENTYGKGSVQELIDITPETSLKVTIARWLTPLGNSISDGGLTPDIVVEITPEDRKAEKDPQMERAVLFLTKGE